MQREHRRVELHGEVLPATERAADTGEVDTDLIGLESEAGRDLIAVHVKPLRRDMDVDAALAVGDGDARLRAEERLVLLADVVSALHDDLAESVGIPAPDDHRAHDVRARIVPVPVPHRGSIRVERLHLRRALRIGDGLERLVLDANRRRRAACLLGLVGGDDCDGLAVVTDPVDREHRLVGEVEAVRLLPGDVLVRQRGVDARHRERLGDVDGENPRVHMRAADGAAPEHSGCVEVARVGELAGDLRHGIGAPCGRNGGPGAQRPRRRAHRLAAACTASRIFA